MIAGDRTDFAIEAFHEPLGQQDDHVFGRMCCWCQGKMLGDLGEPSCLLGVTAQFFGSVISRAPELLSEELSGMEDAEAFLYIDSKIYTQDDRSVEQVATDATNYFKYDFLTNGGESFDNIKSFIIGEPGAYRILFYDFGCNAYEYTKVSETGFLSAVEEFLTWHSEQLAKLTRRQV